MATARLLGGTAAAATERRGSSVRTLRRRAYRTRRLVGSGGYGGLGIREIRRLSARGNGGQLGTARTTDLTMTTTSLLGGTATTTTLEL
jgi:hypothetical protein